MIKNTVENAIEAALKAAKMAHQNILKQIEDESTKIIKNSLNRNVLKVRLINDQYCIDYIVHRVFLINDEKKLFSAAFINEASCNDYSIECCQRFVFKNLPPTIKDELKKEIEQLVKETNENTIIKEHLKKQLARTERIS